MRSFDDRYNEHKVAADQRPKIVYTYYVTGRRDFPFDMLRHDCAWPLSGVDAAKLQWGFEGRSENRTVQLRSFRKPTIDRWSSFGWSVGFAAVVEP